MNGLSASTRALLRVAKSDVPRRAARAKIWMGVASTAGVGAGAAAAAAGSASLAPGAAGAAGTLYASKLLAIGALLGSAVTVGIAVAVLRVAPLSPPPRGISVATADLAALTDRAPTAPPLRPDPDAVPITLAPASTAPNVVLPVMPKSPARARAGRTSGEAPLMREAALLAEARGSLMRGDAQGALAAAQAAVRVGSGELEPEELSVESHAFRALGREQEAGAAEARLKALFPEHALSR